MTSANAIIFAGVAGSIRFLWPSLKTASKIKAPARSLASDTYLIRTGKVIKAGPVTNALTHQTSYVIELEAEPIPPRYEAVHTFKDVDWVINLIDPGSGGHSLIGQVVTVAYIPGSALFFSIMLYTPHKPLSYSYQINSPALEKSGYATPIEQAAKARKDTVFTLPVRWQNADQIPHDTATSPASITRTDTAELRITAPKVIPQGWHQQKERLHAAHVAVSDPPCLGTLFSTGIIPRAVHQPGFHTGPLRALFPVKGAGRLAGRGQHRHPSSCERDGIRRAGQPHRSLILSWRWSNLPRRSSKAVLPFFPA